MPDNSIGAIWERSYDGEPTLYIKVKIGELDYEFTAYPNQYKKEDKHPAWKVYIKSRTKANKDNVEPIPGWSDDVPF